MVVSALTVQLCSRPEVMVHHGACLVFCVDQQYICPSYIKKKAVKDLEDGGRDHMNRGVHGK